MAFLRANWLRLAIFAVGAAALIAAAAAAMPSSFLRGLVVGVGATAVVSSIIVLDLMATGVAPTRMGASAEQWTAGELRHLSRRGWKLVNHFGLGHGDIDHLLIGPAGLVVVETKWSSSGWKTADSDAALQAAVSQVKRSARVRSHCGVRFAKPTHQCVRCCSYGGTPETT